MRIPCSVPILTLDRVNELRRLLSALTERFEDVFLIDGNSSDGTREYARSLGVRVERQFDDDIRRPIADFAAARQSSWAMARFPWIFWIDSDEVATPELLDRVCDIVASGDPMSVHSFIRVPQLPDGRIVEEAFYFPERIIRLFHRNAGLRLVDRPVHEKCIVPEGVRIIKHEERIIAPWPDPAAMWPRQRRYIALDGIETKPDWVYLIRWIWFYNVRSLAGQFARAVCASWRAMRSKKTALPWSYNRLFFKYRILRIVLGTKEWFRRRYRNLPRLSSF